MKKLFVIIAIGALVLASCKKDWTCQCSLNGVPFTSIHFKDTSKSDAESNCSGISGDTLICEIK